MAPVNRRVDLTKQTWDILVEAAAQRRLLTYGELAARLSRTGNPMDAQSTPQVLMPIMLYCDAHKLPRLNDLVVGSQSGRPNYAPPEYDFAASKQRIFAFDWGSVSVAADDFAR